MNIRPHRSRADRSKERGESWALGCSLFSIAGLGFLSMIVLLSASPIAGSESSPPFLLDTSNRDPVELARKAGEALAAPILTVTDKSLPSPSGDPHDYVSYSRYWWPDPESPDGLPYIRHDGRSNRKQVELGDRGEFSAFTKNVSTLALAWHLEQRADCAKQAGEWLRAWFVDPATRMNPNLDYAQIRLGHNDNLGSNFGILDTRGFTRIIDSIGLLENSPALSAQDGKAIRQWFTDYSRWLLTSENGRLERAARNNHGTWYFVQAIAILRFLEDEEQARQLARESRARIKDQFAADGSQPLEIVRVDGLDYSHFNLRALFQLAALNAPLGIDLWNYVAPNGASLRAGLTYLLPFNSAPETWPHQQEDVMDPGFLEPLIDQGDQVWSASRLSGAEIHHYRKGMPEPMSLYLFKPEDWQASDQRPALVFFFGGGWTRGSPEKSASWAHYAARLGMVGIAPDYRTRQRFDTSPLESVADGRAAVRWVQQHAKELGVDPAKVVVGGSSAGGHVALWTAITETPPGSDVAEAPGVKPAALFLVSPVSDTSSLSGYTPRRFGSNALALSPLHQVNPKMPPILVFHGDADPVVPYSQSVALRDKLKGTGNDCKLVTVPGGNHGFSSQFPEWKEKSRSLILEFLTKQEMLPVSRKP